MPAQLGDALFRAQWQRLSDQVVARVHETAPRLPRDVIEFVTLIAIDVYEGDHFKLLRDAAGKK